MAYTIQEAKALYDTYGTLSIADGDACFTSIYDDENDVACPDPDNCPCLNYPIAIEPWCV